MLLLVWNAGQVSLYVALPATAVLVATVDQKICYSLKKSYSKEGPHTAFVPRLPISRLTLAGFPDFPR